MCYIISLNFGVSSESCSGGGLKKILIFAFSRFILILQDGATDQIKRSPRRLSDKNSPAAEMYQAARKIETIWRAPSSFLLRNFHSCPPAAF
jgi:hypothetical protein